MEGGFANSNAIPLSLMLVSFPQLSSPKKTSTTWRLSVSLGELRRSSVLSLSFEVAVEVDIVRTRRLRLAASIAFLGRFF